MRAVICVLLSLLAGVATSAAVVLALSGIVVADPDQPGRLGAVALSSPGLRDEASDYLVQRLEQEGLASGATVTDAQARRVTEVALADPAVRDALAQAEVTPDGGIRLAGVYGAVADRLEEEGRGKAADQVRQLPDRPVDTGSLGDELGQIASTARAVLLTLAAVAAAGAVVLGGLALLAARRRLFCFGAILVTAGLLVAVTLEVLPALAGDAGAGSQWLGAARGLGEVLGTPGTVTIVGLVVLGAVLGLLGLRASRPGPPAADR